jgi:hypothetical protein
MYPFCDKYNTHLNLVFISAVVATRRADQKKPLHIAAVFKNQADA